MAVIKLSLAVSLFLLIFEAAAQQLPICQSANSDSDGDGFGWENNASCAVAPETTGQCENRGDYPWGWNPITLRSCRLDTDDDRAACIDTPPNNDGWGWDGNESCQIPIEMNISRCEESGSGVWGWNPTTNTSCRLELAGSPQEVLSYFNGGGYIDVPRLNELYDIPMVCRKVQNDGIDENGEAYDHLTGDENAYYEGALKFDGLNYFGTYVLDLNHGYVFHEPKSAALNRTPTTSPMWKFLEDSPSASFLTGVNSLLFIGDGNFPFVSTGDVIFQRNRRGELMVIETSRALNGISQSFQTSICVQR